MADSWELAQFGTLNRDGSGDFDRDGISDLDEYLNGLEVSLHAEPGTNLIAYPHQVPPAHDTCTELLTALGATGPDDKLLRLDPITQRYQTCTSATLDADPGHFGIATGEGYVLEVELAHELTLNGTPLCNAPALLPGLNGSSSTNIAQPTACIDFFGDLGFRAGGYIVTCNKPSIWSCSGVGVLV